MRTFENLQVSVLNVSLCCDKHINPVCAHDPQSYFADNSCTFVINKLISFIRNLCLKGKNGGVVGVVVSWHTA